MPARRRVFSRTITHGPEIEEVLREDKFVVVMNPLHTCMNTTLGLRQGMYVGDCCFVAGRDMRCRDSHMDVAAGGRRARSP